MGAKEIHTGRIEVFLCDDVEAFRALLRYTLEDEPDIVVVGEAADGRAGIAGVAQARPHVVLLDLAMPGIDGLTALPQMLDASPDSRIIVLSGFTADTMAEGLVKAGAVAYVEKGAELPEIVAAVREAVAA